MVYEPARFSMFEYCISSMVTQCVDGLHIISVVVAVDNHF